MSKHKTDWFSFNRRNPGHWDVSIDIPEYRGRAFCIRGGPGHYYVRDERPEKNNPEPKEFKTVGAATAYITDELMHELIIAEGQKPTVIECWNVPGTTEGKPNECAASTVRGNVINEVLSLLDKEAIHGGSGVRFIELASIGVKIQGLRNEIPATD